jgi:hypothetical protein
MCFEFEWLYWAQLAQEKASRDEQAAQPAAAEEVRAAPQAAAARSTDRPAHA